MIKNQNLKQKADLLMTVIPFLKNRRKRPSSLVLKHLRKASKLPRVSRSRHFL